MMQHISAKRVVFHQYQILLHSGRTTKRAGCRKLWSRLGSWSTSGSVRSNLIVPPYSGLEYSALTVIRREHVTGTLSGIKCLCERWRSQTEGRYSGDDSNL